MYFKSVLVEIMHRNGLLNCVISLIALYCVEMGSCGSVMFICIFP